MNNIGDRIKQRRKELKLSADVVAEKLGVSRSTVFRYEKGEYRISKCLYINVYKVFVL